MKMTKEEVENTFADVKLKFSHYFKFSFSFVAEGDGFKITGVFGGDSDSIYRYDLSNDEEVSLGDCLEDSWHSVTITKSGEEIFQWDDY